MNYSWSTPQSNSDGECSAVFCERPRDRGLDSSLGCSATRAVHAASLCARRGQIHSRNDATPASRYVALTCSSQDAGCDTGNELPSDGTYTYTYDQNGNTLTKTNTATGDQWQYRWDYHNQLVEAVEKTKDGVVENDEKFIYDIKGRLIGVVINGVQQRWTVFDGANVYLDFNGAGTGVAARYLTSPGAYGTLYARVSADGTVSWYITDLLGSVRQIVDTSGNVLDAIVYDPWGNIVSESNPANGDRFKYAGGQYDAIQGMYLFGARWENPQDGRWESPDPLGLLPDSNPYRYVKNQPTGLKDRTGEAITVSREGITVTFTEWTLTYGSGKRIDLTKEVGTGERILLPPGKNVVEAKADVTNAVALRRKSL